MVSHTITYSDATNGNICGTAIIPSRLCEEGVCSHIFEVTSLCINSTSINVSVSATNILGDGPQTDPVTVMIEFIESRSK